LKHEYIGFSEFVNVANIAKLEFTLNRVVFKIFGALPKDVYRNVCR